VNHLALRHIARAVIFLTGLLACPAWSAPDEESLGKSQGYPVGTRLTLEQEPHLVASYSGGREQFFPYHTVRKAETEPLPRAALPARFSYTFDDRKFTADDYLDRQRVTGLLVLKDGRIVLERYQYDRTEANRFVSQSMAKSVTSLLTGLAIQEGKIRALDDLAKAYVPALAGNPYGETSLRHLLQMSSGITFREVYSGTDDVATLSRLAVGGQGPGGVAVLEPFRNNQRHSPPGTKFVYASIETEVLGLVVRQAVGMSLADYLSQRIWQPMGAEADAIWFVDKSGQEAAYCCLAATLRDYGRLGMLLANDGVARGKQVVPRAWIAQATEPTPGYPHLRPGVATPYLGYGYQFWIFPGDHRRFALFGVRGQAIFVDPALKLVLVQTAVWKDFTDPEPRRERDAFWRGVVAQYGEW
jgi:CubicO group peptidase (beta-lactamase class C family)